MTHYTSAALALAASLWGAGFQPSAPYHATFFYPWYPDWSDRGHAPPQNWFSNYLPDVDPCKYDPPSELYNSTDDRIIYWQLGKMAEARIEVAIASWWGQGHKTDAAMRHIFDVMERAGNPYPNLRWAMYYEKESLGDPPVSELVADLKYIQANFASRPAYLYVNGKPVVFVYAAGGDASAMAARWAEARAQTGFYVVLKVYAGYRTDPNQPDSWHQYAPANRSDRQAPYSWLVSPGFWLDGEAPRLARDLAAFRQAVAEMVAAPVTWKLIQTWNEWGEGTSVEPGEQVIQTKTGEARPDPDGAPFKNLYVEALAELLPPLEQGTGAPEPPVRLAAVVNAAQGQAGTVAPGEIVSIYGERLGPSAGAGAGLDETGRVANSLAGVQALFGCRPAPLLYVQDRQVNAIAPYAVAGGKYVEVQIRTGTDSSLVKTMAVSSAAPGIFAIVNQDGSINSPANPAPRGSTIVLYATGEGETDPAGEDGLPASPVLPKPKLPVKVAIAGIETELQYAGAAPGAVAGVLQVNARVPPAIAPGAELPLTLTVGDFSSPARAIAVR